MRNRPTLDELRDALRQFRETADPTAPSHKFYARVAENVAALIAREEELGPRFERAEAERLSRLLDDTGTLDGLNRMLCDRIADGSVDPLDPDLLAHLRATARENLAIDNPRYASYVRDRETG